MVGVDLDGEQHGLFGVVVAVEREWPRRLVPLGGDEVADAPCWLATKLIASVVLKLLPCSTQCFDWVVPR